MRIGKLVMKEPSGKVNTEKRIKYRWECDCGNSIIAAKNYVLYRKYTCCGCSRVNNQIKHSMYGTRIYKIWSGLKNRCTNKNNKDYQKYSKRGICQSWMEFENFYRDMGDLPFAGCQIDRIDNNGPYEKENCRWTTVKENSRNRGNNYFWIIGNDRYDSIQDVADSYGVKVASAWRWFTEHTCRGRLVKPRDGYVKVRKYE